MARTLGSGTLGSGLLGGYEEPASVAYPSSRNALPVVVVQLRIGAVTHCFSDIEYGDAGARWHEARLVGDIEYSREATCVLWGARRGSNGIGNIELINDDGALDALATGLQFDADVTCFDVDQDQPMSEAIQVAKAVVSAIEARGESTLRIVTGDIMDRLDVPLQSSLFVSGDGVDSIVGRPRPVVIGNPLSCPIVLVDGVDYEYACNDSASFDVVTVRDRGYPLDEDEPPANGWRRSLTAGLYGIELLQLPTGRIVADLSSTGLPPTEIIGAAEGDFATDLDDWTLSDTGAATVAWDASGASAMTADSSAGAARSEMEFPHLISADERFEFACDVEITAVTGTAGYAGIQAFFRPDSLAPGEFISLGRVTTAGSTAILRTFTAPSAGKLVIECAASAAATVEGLVDNVRLAQVPIGGTPVEMVEALLARAGIGIDAIDEASIAALAAARPWPMSFFAESATRTRDAMQQALDSVFGWLTTGADGQIAVGYLQPPEVGDSVFEISDDELAGEIEQDRDHAPGLSTTVAGQRNFYRYGAGELADAIDDDDRPALTADFRVRATATDPVGIELGNRAGASVSEMSESGIPTLLDDADDIQAAADYLAALYPANEPRRFFKIPVFISRAQAATLRPGALITLTKNRFGCEGGRRLRLVKIEGRVGQRVANLVAWGTGIDA